MQTSAEYTTLPHTNFTAFHHPGRQTQSVEPVIRFVGSNLDGQSVLCRVWGFLPYFLCEIPDWLHERNKDDFMHAINSYFHTNSKEWYFRKTAAYHPGTNAIQRIDFVERQNLKGFGAKKMTVMKISTGHPKYVSRLRDKLIRGEFVFGEFPRFPRLQAFEANIDFPLRYMIDKDITGSSWIEIKRGTYRHVRRDQQTSWCGIEIDCHANDVIPRPDIKVIPPLVTLSVDIECLGYHDKDDVKKRKKQHFPKAKRKICHITQIACTLTRQGEKTPFHKNCFVLGSCGPVPGCEIYAYTSKTKRGKIDYDSQTEGRMLAGWAEFVRVADPDIITGWNIIGFDIPYLIDRAKFLNVKNFQSLGRIKNLPCQYYLPRQAQGSTQTGMRILHNIMFHGRVILDGLIAVRQLVKLGSYALNNVASIYIGEQKEEIKYFLIWSIHESGPGGRARLASYCVQDAVLPQKLMDCFMLLYNTIGMSRVSGVPMTMVLTRGQQIKVTCQLLRYCKNLGLILPYTPPRNGDVEKFDGATVLDPVIGFHKDFPVSVLDFASLYPSIMIAWNLCYTTLVSKAEAMRIGLENCHCTPIGQYFVKKKIKEGLLPQIAKRVLAARKAAKKEMKKWPEDSVEYGVLNARQLALKVFANSLYGYTGALKHGHMPCAAIAKSITSYGRKLLVDIAKFIKVFCKKRRILLKDVVAIYGDTPYSRTLFGQITTFVEKFGTDGVIFPEDVEVIYGDTDSVFFKFHVTEKHARGVLGFFGSRRDVMLMGSRHYSQILQDMLESIFPPEIVFRWEKELWRLLLLGKKKYAALHFESSMLVPKYINFKGIEAVRRDTVPFVASAQKIALYFIFEKEDEEAALEHLKLVASVVLSGNMSLGGFVTSKNYAKEHYVNPQPHSELVEKMKKRPGAVPKLGDRVPFVLQKMGWKNKSTCKVKAYHMAEDPDYMLEHGLPVEIDYYMIRKFRKVIDRTFFTRGKNGKKGAEVFTQKQMNELWGGDGRKRKIVVQSNMNKKGGMGRFVKVEKTCMGCRKHIRVGAVCLECEHNGRGLKVYDELVKDNNHLVTLTHRTWTHCQRCQNRGTEKLYCSNTNCGIYFLRTEARNRLHDSCKKLERFDEGEAVDLDW